MPTVFLTQEPFRRYGFPIMDLTPAKEYGHIQALLPPGPIALSTAPMMKTLRAKLENFSDDDFLLGIGDPVAIAAAVMAASDANNGLVNILRWDREKHRYDAITLNLYPNRKDIDGL